MRHAVFGGRGSTRLLDGESGTDRTPQILSRLFIEPAHG